MCKFRHNVFQENEVFIAAVLPHFCGAVSDPKILCPLPQHLASHTAKQIEREKVIMFNTNYYPLKGNQDNAQGHH